MTLWIFFIEESIRSTATKNIKMPTNEKKKSGRSARAKKMRNAQREGVSVGSFSVFGFTDAPEEHGVHDDYGNLSSGGSSFSGLRNSRSEHLADGPYKSNPRDGQTQVEDQLGMDARSQRKGRRRRREYNSDLWRSQSDSVFPKHSNKDVEQDGAIRASKSRRRKKKG